MVWRMALRRNHGFSDQGMKNHVQSMPTLREICDAQGIKKDYDRYLLLGPYFFRPIGYLVTWLAVRATITSEGVSWLSGAVGLSGLALLVGGSKNALPVGLGLLLFFNVLDCVDGSIARSMKTQNPYGRFLDSVCGGIIDLAFWATVGIIAFRHPQLLQWPNPFEYGPLFWLTVGGITCFLCEALGFLEHRFDELLRPYWESRSRDHGRPDQNREETPDIDPATLQGRQSAWPPRLIVATNLRVRETHYFLLVIAYLTNTVDVLLSGYLVYYLSHSLLLLGVYCIRGRQVRQSYLARK